MFILHNSNRIEILAHKLSEVMAGYEAPPLVPRTIVVNNQGMARWLSFKLASMDSICANVHFPMPASFIGQLAQRLLAEKKLSPPVDSEQLAWLLLGAIPRWLPSTSLSLPGHFRLLNRDKAAVSGRELYGLAQHLGELFEKYLIYRPDMVLAWEEGQVYPDHLEEGQMWQPSLWRFVTSSFTCTHRASLLKAIRERLKAPLPADLFPCPVALFGICHLPPVYLDLFFLLAKHIDVHLFVLNPCRTFWEDVKTPKKKLKYHLGDKSLSDFHPLLESLGTVGKDFLHLIYERLFGPDIESDEKDYFETLEDGSVLSWLQAGILEGQGTKTAVFKIAEDDFSIQIHSCHSPLREVEVLHDQLLDLFDNMSDLHPHDVLVMAPDIQRYAPFIEAVFGGQPAGSKRMIPWAITDLPEEQQSPLIKNFLKILDLSISTVTAPVLMDIIECPSTARRFGLDGEGLAVVRQLVAESGIRRELGFAKDIQNSWRFGLDRLLGSYSFSGESFLHSVLPFETPVEGDMARYVGSLSFFVSKISAFLEELSKARSPSAWQYFITEMVKAFFQPEASCEKQATILIMDAAARLRELGETAEIELLPWEIVRLFLRDRLRRPVPARNFISGKVTFSSLVPMRSIPARVICLLGMNDVDFPRRRAATNFDLVTRSPRPGDKFPRDEDRYLFLETIISARDCLYISYVGRSQKDNSPKVPSGVVSELLDFLEQYTRGPNGEAACRYLVTEHPLMPFSAAYSEHKHPRLFTYADEWCRPSHHRASEKADPEAPFWTQQLKREKDGPEKVDLSQFIYFFSNPARFFLSHSLGLDLRMKDTLLVGDEPFSFSGLDHYMYANELIHVLMERGEQALVEHFQRLKGQGRLPLPPFDRLFFSYLIDGAMKIVSRIKKAGTPPIASNVNINIGGIRLTGNLWTSEQNGTVSFRAAKIKASDRLSAWIKHLIATMVSGKKVDSIHVGTDASLELAGVDVKTASDHLLTLMDIYMEGHTRPLPLLPDASFAFVRKYIEILRTKNHDTALSLAMTQAKKRFLQDNYIVGRRIHERWLEVAFRGRQIFDEEFQHLSITVFEPLIEKSREYKN